MKSASTTDPRPAGKPDLAGSMRPVAVVFALLINLVLVLSALAIWQRAAEAASVLLVLVVASAAYPWQEAWAAARGTALRPALVWVALALLSLLVSNVFALGEPLATGRPAAGRFTYLGVLAFLAAFVSVLNARTPGAGVWAGLMVVLVVVFLIPWLEAPGRLRRAQGLAQLHLDAPWTFFYFLLVAVGVTNYLPTRFGVASLCFAVGFVLEFLALVRPDWPPERRAILWCWVAWVFPASLWVARYSARHGPRPRLRLENLWFWYRDAWGVVWGLRTLERFNRSAALLRWPIRLGWFGVSPGGPVQADAPLAVPGEAEAAFRGLLRRFVEARRLEEV